MEKHNVWTLVGGTAQDALDNAASWNEKIGREAFIVTEGRSKTALIIEADLTDDVIDEFNLNDHFIINYNPNPNIFYSL